MVYIDYMLNLSALPRTQAHPPREYAEDVLEFFVRRKEAGQDCALIMLTETRGGAVRAEGAMMAVCQSGQIAGYMSGGCVDADIILQAHQAMKTGQARKLCYGQGSPFLDIQLPCGGQLNIVIWPDPPLTKIHACLRALKNRQSATLTLREPQSETGDPILYTAHHKPKLALRLIGRGADPIALTQIAQAAGIPVDLWSTEPECLAAIEPGHDIQTQLLQSRGQLPPIEDDAQTAIILMMHDTDWEVPILQQALSGKAFYIGAVGSQKTRARRSAALKAAGVTDQNIQRIKGPVGLVPSLRQASFLAVSTLAEIISIYHKECL